MNEVVRWCHDGRRSSASVEALASARSMNGPAANPPGFHQIALESDATATKAPPIPSARGPVDSTIWAEAGTLATRQSSAILTSWGKRTAVYFFD